MNDRPDSGKDDSPERRPRPRITDALCVVFPKARPISIRCTTRTEGDAPCFQFRDWTDLDAAESVRRAGGD